MAPIFPQAATPPAKPPVQRVHDPLAAEGAKHRSQGPWADVAMDGHGDGHGDTHNSEDFGPGVLLRWTLLDAKKLKLASNWRLGSCLEKLIISTVSMMSQRLINQYSII